MNKTKTLLLLILLVGFVFRFYRFDNPVADWHSWRQADTSSVSRNFAQDGFDFLHPRMDNISNVQSGLENPQGYFFVEFPIYNAAQAGLFKLFGLLTLEEWGRLVTIISSTVAAFFLYLIVSRHSNKTIGLLTAAFYTFIPFDIYYGRVILTDPSMVMATLGAIYFFDLWTEQTAKSKNKKGKEYFYYVLALIFTAGTLLLKAQALFFVLPIIYLAFKRFGWKTFLQWQLWLFAILAVAPLGAWRIWMAQYPEGIPANAWLFNGNGIRFHPAFFRWIFYERLTKLFLGYFGIGIFAFGLFALGKIKEWMFFVTFLFSSLLYVCILATGNVQHDYYQIPVMPTIAIICAIGSYYLYQLKKPIGKIVLVVLLLGGFYFSWLQVRDFFNINNPSIIIAGKAVDQLAPKNAKVIAIYDGDSSFLYQTKRKGWASFEKPLPDMVKMGASYLVLVNPTPQDHAFAKDYKIVAATKEYILYDLGYKKKNH